MQQLRSWARRVPTDPARPASTLPTSTLPTSTLTAPQRRIRHEARDRLLVAGCSLGLSAGAAGLLWLLSWWLS